MFSVQDTRANQDIDTLRPYKNSPLLERLDSASSCNESFCQSSPDSSPRLVKADSGYLSDGIKQPAEKGKYSPKVAAPTALDEDETSELRRRQLRGGSYEDDLVDSFNSMNLSPAQDAPPEENSGITEEPVVGVVVEQNPKGVDSGPPDESIAFEENVAIHLDGIERVSGSEAIDVQDTPVDSESYPDISESLVTEFGYLKDEHKRIVLNVVDIWLKANGIDPKEHPTTAQDKKKWISIGQSLTKLADVLNVVMSWAAYMGAAYVITTYPSQDAIATIVIGSEECHTQGQMSGRAVTYEIGDRHYIPSIMRAAVLVCPLMMNAFLKVSLTKIGNLITAHTVRHICKDENCFYIDTPSSERICILTDPMVREFADKIITIPADVRQKIIREFIRLDGKQIWTDKSLPLTADIVEVGENLILKRDKRYTLHGLITLAGLGFWTTYTIVGRNMEIFLITSIANVTIGSNGTGVNCTMPDGVTEAQAPIVGYVPTLMEYAVNVVILWGVFYFIPHMIPIAQAGVYYLGKSAYNLYKRCLTREIKED